MQGWESHHAKSLQSWSNLCDPMDLACQAPLSTGFFKQEYWIGMPSSRGSSQPGDQTHISDVSCISRQGLYH